LNLLGCSLDIFPDQDVGCQEHSIFKISDQTQAKIERSGKCPSNLLFI